MVPQLARLFAPLFYVFRLFCPEHFKYQAFVVRLIVTDWFTMTKHRTLFPRTHERVEGYTNLIFILSRS